MTTRHIVAAVDDIAPGTSKIVDINGRAIGIFNVNGEFFALLNRCPHAAAELCKGNIVALVQSDGVGDYQLHRHGEFVRCPWHGWEFEISTGQSWCDPGSLKVKQYEVAVEPGANLVKGPFVAESFAVDVEGEYVVLEV